MPRQTTRSEQLEHIQKLKDMMANLEWKHKEIKHYKAWRKLQPEEKNRIEGYWQEYYRQAKQTKAGLRYAKMKQLVKQNNWGLIKEYAQKAREQIENNDWELVEPKEIYGGELINNFYVGWWVDLENKLKSLEYTGYAGEVEDIFTK